jgi:DegV family protein with EDD domain
MELSLWHESDYRFNIKNPEKKFYSIRNLDLRVIIYRNSPEESLMSRIDIVTDTDSALPPELAKKYHILQIPILIQFGEETFRTGIDIDDATTFARIDRDGKLPTTTAPTPGQFLEAFQAAFDSGAESILCISISCEMSATHSSAQKAAEMLPDRRIEVVDSRSCAMGQGFMAIAAAQAVAGGATVEQAIVAAEEIRGRTYLFGALPTLRYIAMSGRVSLLAAGMAGLLDIKPILSLQEGKLDLLEKVRTQNKAWKRAVDLSLERAAGRKLEQLAILHVNAPGLARQFDGLVRKALPCPAETIFCEMTPGLSVHVGAGMVAVVFVTER